MLRKNDERNNCQKISLVCALPETEDHIDSFQVDVPSSCQLETSENLWVLIFLGG